jgi:uncharacterized protein YjbI with pentapeptide repeats
MANDDYIAQLKKGAAAWNAWLAENLEFPLDLSGADLSGADVRGANLREANLRGANPLALTLPLASWNRT